MGVTRNFKNLTFSLYPEAHETRMYESYYRDGAWDEGAIVPFHNIELSPAANILNYGQGIFEGMKAYRSVKGKIVMFRPEKNARRFARSCLKLAIPEVPVEKFMDAVKRVVLENEEFIPESEDGKYSMYLRPVCIGTEPLLGVRASKEYLFYIFASPVGPYFDKVGVVRLIVTDVHRASPNGTGDAKAVCNYAVTMPPHEEAKKKGFDGVLFLDPIHNRYVEEAGAANFFALLSDDTLVTPPLGTILPGITRESIIHLAREMFGMKVEERDISIDEVCDNAKECFLCGTGATITSISTIGWQNKEWNVNKNDFQLAHRLYDTLIGIQLQKLEDPYGWVMELT
ncbi:MAG: branched-chain amino acid aminotransferase [Methanobacteriota archaeon]|nr:MAG: branched-chain amino acid aminotransferase [Euryarchaeota archaeon]